MRVKQGKQADPLIESLKAIEGASDADRLIAEFRLRCLQQLWRERRKAKGCNLTAVIQGVVASLRREYPDRRLSVSRLYEWDKQFRNHGVVGLLRGHARRRERWNWVALSPALAKQMAPELEGLLALGGARCREGRWFLRWPGWLDQRPASRHVGQDIEGRALGAYILGVFGASAVGAAAELYARNTAHWLQAGKAKLAVQSGSESRR